MSFSIYTLEEKPLCEIQLYRPVYGYNTDSSLSIWRKENLVYNYRGDGIMFLKDPKDIADSIKKVKSTLKSQEVLYFDKTSKFPRFKLQGSPHKRCIKSEKATKIILGNDVQTALDDAKYRYKSDSSYITLVEESDKYIMWGKSYENDFKTKFCYGNNSIFQTLKNKGTLSSDAKLIYEGKMCILSKLVGEASINVLESIYTDVMFDKDLDKALSKTMEQLDSDSLDSIKEMVNSEDAAVVAMGLKLIPNYNVMDFKLSLNTILSMAYQKCSSVSIWNSTAVKQLRETIEFKEPYYPSFPGCIENIKKSGVTYTEDDITYARNLIIDAVREQMSKVAAGLEATISNYNIHIKTDVQ